MNTPEDRPPLPSSREPRWPWLVGTGVLVAAGALWAISGYLHDRGWTRAATVDEVSSRGVIFLPEHEMFLVSTPAGPFALSAISPHLDHRLFFCRSSGLFEGEHGEKFDRFGSYFAGPAPRSMDRVELRIEGEEVLVNANHIDEGGARDDSIPLNSQGDFCPDGVESPTEPGFAVDPR